MKPEWHNTTNEYKIFLHRDNAISEELLAENQINNLKESLKGIDQEQSINVKLRYDQVNKEMGILEHECSDLDTEYGQIENSIRAIRKSSEFEKAKTSDAVKRTEAAERVETL